jgi:hypothetical protein
MSGRQVGDLRCNEHSGKIDMIVLVGTVDRRGGLPSVDDLKSGETGDH